MRSTTTLRLPIFLFAILFVWVVVALAPAPQHDRQAVNQVIGDLSFTSKFGHSPDASTDEDLRIRTHLAYVEERLRHSPIPPLCAAQQAQRMHILDLLHDYWVAGTFPRNHDYTDERRPCFIDLDGRICAVGYLVEQTVGRAAAEAINGQHQYEDLLAMGDPALDRWIANTGLSKLEYAMIQPGYGYDSVNHRPLKGPWARSQVFDLKSELTIPTCLDIKNVRSLLTTYLKSVSMPVRFPLGPANMPACSIYDQVTTQRLWAYPTDGYPINQRPRNSFLRYPNRFQYGPNHRILLN